MTIHAPLARMIHEFDPDTFDSPALAFRLEVEQNEVEQPVHQHRKGQLILTLHGAVICEVPKAMWMVPPHHAVWIPGGMPHSNRATHNAQIYLLFIEEGAERMPDKCCTLAISPLIREMICHLAMQDPDYPRNGSTARFVAVLMEQLVTAHVKQLHLPISSHPKIRRIAIALASDLADRTTQAQWAQRLAMSDRTLARLEVKETGLTFRHWRKQLHLIIALRRLASGESVQTVAGNLGYDSVTAFITMFKKALGSSPTQYFAALK